MDNLIGILYIFVQNEDTLERALALNLLPGFLFYYLEHLGTDSARTPGSWAVQPEMLRKKMFLSSWIRVAREPSRTV